MKPASDMQLRRIRPDELQAAHAFVQSVVDETYAFIWENGAPPIDETDWSPAWVAVDGPSIMALMLTVDDCLDDLWIARPHRGCGLGSNLLAQAEEEIRARGFRQARLRVVAGNQRAVDFYGRRGWTAVRRYPHGRLPIEMIDFVKQLAA